MGNVIINLIGIVIVIVLLFCFLGRKTGWLEKWIAKRLSENRIRMQKKSAERLGKRIVVPRDGKEGTAVNLYSYEKTNGSIPAVFLLHGGLFTDGDADQMDSFCARMKEQWEMTIISINYHKMPEYQFPYQQEEIKDVICYFGIHSYQYHLDTDRFFLCGFSAGAYLGIGAAAFLKEIRFPLAGMIALYPVIDESLFRYADLRLHVSPFTLVTCMDDVSLSEEASYVSHLQEKGIDVTVKQYPETVMGFMEYGNPEFQNDAKAQKRMAVSEDQTLFAKACEIWMGSEFERFAQLNKAH